MIACSRLIRRLSRLLLLAALPAWSAGSITLNQTCPSNPNPNSTVSYAYSIKNSTGRSASYHTIVVTLANSLTYQSFSGTGWSCSFASPKATCVSYTKVSNGATSAILTITATTPATTGAIATSATATTKRSLSSSSSFTSSPSACSNTVVNPTPGVFNVSDSAGTCAGTAINTKIAGTTIPLKVTALNSARTGTDTTVNSSIAVYLVDMSSMAMTPANTTTNCPNALSLNASNRPNSYLVTNSVTLASGVGVVTLPAVSGAYRKVGVFAVNTANINNYACATDLFAIRPNDFVVSVTDNDWKSAGTNRSLNNTSTGGTVHVAGRPFTITVTARDAAGTAMSTYSGLGSSYFYDSANSAAITPDVSVASVAYPSGGNAGNVTASFTPSGSAGQIRSTNAAYDETGSINLLVVDDVFAAEDAKNLCSAASDRNIQNTPASTPVGRFVPELLTVTDTSTPKFKTFDSDNTQCPSRQFTYIGQPFGYSVLPGFTVRAWAYDVADYSPTTNYRATGRLGTLSAAGGKISYSNSNSNSQAIDSTLTGTATINDVGDGTSQITLAASDKIFYTRGASGVAPFNAAISATVTLTDCTDQSGSGTNSCIPICLDPGNTTDSNGLPTCSPSTNPVAVNFSNIGFDAPAANTATPNAFRYGLLSLPATASSPNTNTALTFNMNTMYWTSGSTWASNTLDNCTSVTADAVALSAYTQNLSQCETLVSVSGKMNSGTATLTLSAPGGSNKGTVNVIPNLGSTTSTDYNAVAPCNAASPTAAAAAALPWLQCTSGLLANCSGSNPKTTATFNGTIQSPNRTRHIYLRELF